MANETRDGGEVTQMKESFEEAIEKRDLFQCVNDQVPFRCLVKAKEKKYPYGPFKFRFHLNDHMKKIYHMTLSKVKPGPKIASVIKKNNKKKPGVINAKKMNFKVITNSLKMARNFFWKKSKQWETRAKVAWEKLKQKPITTRISVFVLHSYFSFKSLINLKSF